jgi:uncharacterized repeat protein (TIGR03803 family)
MTTQQSCKRLTCESARNRKYSSAGRLIGWKTACAVLLICTATAIAASAQTFKHLATFDWSNGGYPEAALVQGRDGNLYGTTYEGGLYGWGTVFRLTPTGKLTTLYNFCAQTDCLDGAQPLAGLVLATDGNFYGTTTYGGGGGCSSYGYNGCGTVFKITPGGTLTTLHTFAGYPTDGVNPRYGSLVQGTDGSLYGTTEYGGANLGYGTVGSGTVFRITQSGAVTTLYSFCALTECTDGDVPGGGLVQSTDGSFYGTTSLGGNNSRGTVFKITPAAAFRALYSFKAPNGRCPEASLVQGSDGNFYGTTENGGSSDKGTVFKITPQGALTTLHSFGGKDGEFLVSSLIQATDGNFYGPAGGGGTPGGGTIFEITLDGTFLTLFNFNDNDGENPDGLFQDSGGLIYGLTDSGGTYYDGTVYSLDMGLGPFVAFVRSSGKVGQMVQILGQGFTGTTSVSFNGTPADFIVRKDTFLTATAPAGATTGPVTVTTPSGTLTSNLVFHVMP